MARERSGGLVPRRRELRLRFPLRAPRLIGSQESRRPTRGGSNPTPSAMYHSLRSGTWHHHPLTTLAEKIQVGHALNPSAASGSGLGYISTITPTVRFSRSNGRRQRAQLQPLRENHEIGQDATRNQ